jgi:acyl-CoA reductase-like NAD-dependent aldehyde dehydrogenase
MIVCADADLDITIDDAMWGAFKNCGQVCCSVERLYVDKALYPTFVEALVPKVKSLKVGNGAIEANHIGPMVAAEERDRVLKVIDHIKQSGGKFLTGGHKIEGKGFFIEPTVVTNVPDSCSATFEETFGPVLQIEAVDSMEEAIQRANELDFGLTASVWSKDIEMAAKIARQLEAGTRAVNQRIGSMVQLPWGGVKGSGVGRMLSHEGLLAFTETMVLRLPYQP